MAPQKGGTKAYEVLRAALHESHRVGIARFYLRTRPLLAAVVPGTHVLSLEVMREAKELRDPDDLDVPRAKPSPAELKMARTLVESMSDTFDPTAHPDRYRETLEKHLAKKPERGEKPAKVVDLMEALKQSLGEARGAAGKRATRRRHKAA
jgi:DNA end-binding protein Ku